MDDILPEDCHWKIRALYRYWRSRTGARDMPARIDLDPTDIPDLLADVYLIDVGPEAGRLVYRLAGTAVGELIGQELRGKDVGAGTLEEHRNEVLTRYARIVAERRPFFHRAQLREQTNNYTKVERLILPLSDDGERVNMLLGMLVRRAAP